MIDLLKVAEEVSRKAVERYGENIALIAIYGSIAVGSQSSLSDLDMFAIVDNNKPEGIPFELGFIYQDHPVALWSMTWDDAERMALGEGESSYIWSVAASLFVNHKIIYQRSEEDLQKFNKLRYKVQKVQENRKERLKTVLHLFNKLSNIYDFRLANESNDLLSARWSAWKLINQSCNILAWLNNKWYDKNWGSNLQLVFQLPVKPRDFEKHIRILSTSDDINEISNTAEVLIEAIRNFIVEEQIKCKEKVGAIKANHFVHIKEYLNKIRSGCINEDILLASYAATELQIWISELMALKEGCLANVYEFNQYQEVQCYYNDSKLPDLTTFITENDYNGLLNLVDQLEDRLKVIYERKGQHLPLIKNIEEINLIEL